MSGEQPFDHEALVAEIEDEVRRRRASGDLPPGLEAQLDEVFERLVPRDLGGETFESALETAEQAALIDLNVPIDATNPAFAQVKKVVRKLLLFYMDYVVRELSEFTEASTRATRLLGERVTELERSRDALDDRMDTLRDDAVGAVERLLAVSNRYTDARQRLEAWRDDVVAALDGFEGRVLHADAGDGGLVKALVSLGIDAYGVEPDEKLTEVATERGLDVRTDPALVHLRGVGVEGLGGVVLSGCVERLQAGDAVALIDAAARALPDAGRLIVVTADPASWSEGMTVVEADLAAGRPFHRETWEALLDDRGFVEIAVEGPREGAFLVRATRSR